MEYLYELDASVWGNWEYDFFLFFQRFTVKYDTGNPFLTFRAIVLKVYFLDQQHQFLPEAC